MELGVVPVITANRKRHCETKGRYGYHSQKAEPLHVVASRNGEQLAGAQRTDWGFTGLTCFAPTKTLNRFARYNFVTFPQSEDKRIEAVARERCRTEELSSRKAQSRGEELSKLNRRVLDKMVEQKRDERRQEYG